MESKKLKAIDIIKEALKVFIKNTNFMIFISLISLPLFCFSFYFETSLQNFLFQTSTFLLQQKEDQIPETEILLPVNGTFQIALHSYSVHYGTDWSSPLEIARKLNSDLFHKLLQLGFLYLVPFHLLELLTVLVIVDLASKIYREDKPLTFNDMSDIKIDVSRLCGIFITYGYVVFFSTCILLGFLALLIAYSDILRYFPYGYFDPFYVMGFMSLDFDLFFHLVYGTNLLLLVGIYLCWSAIWNLALVISVLKGTYGAKALGSSAYLSLRNVHNGMILMLVFSIWGVCLRLPCLVFGCYKKWGWVVAQTSLFCLGNALKWASFVVYFDDCIKRIFGKKVDVEEVKTQKGKESVYE